MEFCQLQDCPSGSRCQNLDDGYECIANATFDGVSTAFTYVYDRTDGTANASDSALDTIEITYRSNTGGTLLHMAPHVGDQHFTVSVLKDTITVSWRLDLENEDLVTFSKAQPDGNWTSLLIRLNNNSVECGFTNPTEESFRVSSNFNFRLWYDLLVTGTVTLGGLSSVLSDRHSYVTVGSKQERRNGIEGNSVDYNEHRLTTAVPPHSMMSVSRLVALVFVATTLLSLRFSVMGFSTPKFQPLDNPASFMDNALLRMLNYNYIYCLNVWLLVCPVWLCFDWSMGCIPLITGYDHRLWAVAVFWLTLGALIAYAFLFRRDETGRYTTVGLAMLMVPFLPASNIFFNVGFVLAERTLYIPSAGYCLLVAVGLQRFSTRFVLPKESSIAYAALIALLFTRSWVRSDQWRSEKELFQSALSVCPLNAKVHYNIAKNAADAGNVDLAKLEYREALRLNPEYAQAMNNLGNLLKDNGQLSEAVGLFKEAVSLQKDFATAWMNLGIAQSALMRYEESEASYFTALRYRSNYPDCFYNLGVLYLERKQHDRALKAWINATKQKPAHRRAWTNMVLLLDDLGRTEEALETASEALKLIPDHAPIYFNIANILGKKGRYQEAEVQFKLAISKSPTDPMIYANFGVLYHRWNKLHAAEQMYRRALQLKPDLYSARNNLQKLYALKASTI
ncbi:Transmembrane and TPR repeat-containing protein [Ooceraea biroi]|uniref:dolichyl-phosphate-mannose--protein mannosyltransferase n=1 Tax=Ooceraea biroi TaxID=2015173 RepID=A0A026W8S8_OOCBI|nr:Transmembrane and TPR repeat-containing protein [Ooceraea biroi]